MKKLLWLCATLFVLCLEPARALDLTRGVMSAVPAAYGKAPVVDGDVKDWDWSGAEPMWIAPETMHNLNAEVAPMYDVNLHHTSARLRR